MTASARSRRAALCEHACRGIPDAALKAGGLQQALIIARAALGLAPTVGDVDLDLIRRTVEHLEARHG